MSQLATQLEDFAGRRITFADLAGAVDAIARGNGSASSRHLAQLGEAREAGVLDAEQYHELLSRVIGAERMDVTAAVSTDDFEKTQTFSVSPDADRPTVVGAGSIIKDRFILEGRLGQGGMGVVYKARDRIKIEAKDRNPFVAVKVLNEDFKVHPESFIALQRECSKAQKLAHPNIATVYDFDRTGGMAFMTMEMLDGQPLNEYFATELPDEGLAFDKAWPIIRGLGLALGYAHQNHIVHSDFKPGNAFICENGDVKVLDFGIARAVKAPGQAETTKFDAGKLGALTPTYASPEMLEGDPPDPRDDIYALAVVSYILLTSRHPFDRYPGNMAKALKLEAAPVPGLSRRQNQALRRALAFEREERTPDVAAFLDEMEGDDETQAALERQRRLVTVLGIGFVAMMACVVYLLLR